MKRILILSAVLPFLYCSCVRNSDTGLTPEEARREQRIAGHINAKIHDELQGEGFFKKDSDAMYEPQALITDSYSTILLHYTEVDEVRDVICRIVKEYLIAYNNENQIRPLLGYKPITTDNLNISVYFYDNDHDTLPAPYISQVECVRGDINYYRLNDDEVSERIAQETYEDAMPLTPRRAATAPPL